MGTSTQQIDFVDLINELSKVPILYKDKASALNRLTELGKKALHSHACTLILIDQETKTLKLAACAGFDNHFKKYAYYTFRNTRTNSSSGKSTSLDYNLFASGEIIEKYNLQKSGQGVANPKIAVRYDLQSVLSYPLKSDNHLIGYFNHFSNTLQKFPPDEIHLLESFARHAVLTIERFDYLRMLERTLSILYSLSRELQNLTPHEFLQIVSEKASELLSVPICIIWMLDASLTKLKIVATTGEVDEEYKQLELDIHFPGIQQHLTGKKVGYLEDVTKPNSMYSHPREAKQRGWISLLSAPMWFGEEKLIGMLNLYTKTKRHFKVWEKELFGIFANHAAFSIQKAELMRESQILRYQSQLLDTSAEISYENVDAGEFQQKLSRIVETCAKITNADSCCLRIWNKATNRLELKAIYPRIGTQIQHSFPIEKGIAGYVAKTKKPYYCRNASTDPKYGGFNIGDSIYCAPIKSGDAVIATVSVGKSKPDAFNSDDFPSLLKVLQKVALAIEQAMLNDILLQLPELMTHLESLDVLLKKVVNLTQDLMSEPICIVWLHDKNKDGFVVSEYSIPEGQGAPLKDLVLRNDSKCLTRFLLKNKPYYLEDASVIETHPYYRLVKNLGWKSMLAMPLSYGKKVIGIIEVYSFQHERHFTKWHKNIFKTLALQTSVAIENLNSRRRFQKLNKVIKQMAETRDVNELLRLVLDEGLKLVDSERGWVSRLDFKTGLLHLVEYSGSPPRKHSLKLGRGITGKALSAERPIRVGNVHSSEWKDIYVKCWDDTRSELAVPIVISNAEVRVGKEIRWGSKPIGVLNIESPALNAFSKSDEVILWSLARHAAIMFEKLDFDQKLTQMAQFEKEIVGTSDRTEIVQIVSKAITETLGYEYVNISFVIPELNRIQTEYVVGIPDEEKEIFKQLAIHSLNSNDIQADVVRNRQIEAPGSDDKRYDTHIYKRFHHDRLLRVYIPMIATAKKNQVMGTVEAGYQKGYRKYIYERDVQILKGLVEYSVKALEQHRQLLLEKIQHEFNSALGGIRSNTSFLKRRLPNLPSHLYKAKLDDILTDCEILKLKIEEIQHLLGGESPSSKKERTIVYRDIIIKSIKQFNPLVVGKGLDYKKIYFNVKDAHKIKIYVNRSKLNSVVHNLLTNAIKYAEDDPEKFAIRIDLDEDREYYIIKFKDWGIGIRKSYEEKIFEEGYRTPEAINKDVAGTGLGLPIAKKTMQELGGDLILKNRYKPTEFHVLIPKRLKEFPHDTFR